MQNFSDGNDVLPLLDAMVVAFEDAWSDGTHPDVADFLPASDHPDYETIACELLCIDLEFRQQFTEASLVDEYRSLYPELVGRETVLAQLTLEDYRWQLQHGNAVTPQDYEERYGVATASWPRPPASEAETKAVAKGSTVQTGDDIDRLTKGLRLLPDVGSEVHQFELVEQLGEGQFGRVFQARQKDLANRFVVLKLSKDLWKESDRLARLQHPNIVPIYSVHQEDSIQAVCMPFLGRYTLKEFFRWLSDKSDRPITGRTYLEFLSTGVEDGKKTASKRPETQLVKRLKGYDHEQIGLWIASRLAAGLAHAHDRGILHRDVKPANVLLTDDGEPMILDFNLSQEIVPGGRTSLLVGGTVPYMAPEHLRAVATGESTDVRADIYSLGVILFQLLSGGQLPFSIRQGDFEGSVAAMLTDRFSVPELDSKSKSSAAAKAIVSKCLAPDSAARYQTVVELQEDIERHLANLPLKHSAEPRFARCQKWVKRHPHVESAGFLGTILSLVIAAVATVAIVRGEHLAEMRASRLYQTFVDASDEARGVLSIPPSDRQAYDAAVQAARHAVPLFDLSANGLRDNESFRRLHRDQQQVIRETLTELHFLLAFSAEIQASSLTGDDYRNQLTHALTQNGLAQQAVTPSPWAVFYQRSLLLRKLGRNDEAEQVLDNAPERSSESLFDRYLTSLSLFQSGDLDGSKVLLGRLADETPKNYFVWHLLGSTHMELGELDQAEECFTVCKALSPTSPLAYFQRGVARLEKKKFVEAKGDFDHVLRLTPGNAAALINRAQAWRGLKQYRHAIEDLNTAEKSASYKTRIPLLRAKLWRSLGEEEKAIADIQTGLRVQPVDADDWISRGLVKLPEDVDGALADIRKAVSLRPTYRVGLHNLAMVLAEHKHDYAEALNTYDTMLALNPKDFQALRSRAVVHARRRDRDKATADMARALRLDRSSQTYYQAACVYALVSDGEGLKKHQAVGLLKKALQLDGETWRHFAKADDDLAAIRELSDFQSLLSAVDSVCEQQ